MLANRRRMKLLLLALSCTAASACSDPAERAPDAPTALAALPQNGRAALSWTGAGGATSFNVYYSASPTVTTSDPRITLGGSPAVIPDLANGTPYYFAVSGVNAVGEGPLSSVACAVPTAADTTGLTLHDPLCGADLDGSRWRGRGAYSIGVVGGAAELSVKAVNQAPRAERGIHYPIDAAVRTAPGERVTKLQADLRVPSATASRAGGALVRGVLRLLYQPPATRFEWADSHEHVLFLEVGLTDEGAGLQAFRSLGYCDAIRCPERRATGIAFTDPAGLTAIDPTAAGAPAAYDTTYTVTASLDEATGVFHWTIAGGAFGAGISGSADPTVYLAATPLWSGVPLAGAGFWRGELAARTYDTSQQGGGSGAITVRFDDVRVGLNGGAAAPYDDFSGAGGNSGPEELSAAKWVAAGSDAVLPAGGRLAIRSRVTSTGPAAAATDRLTFAHAEPIQTIQADVALGAALSTGSTAHVNVQGTFYNDGSPAGAPASPLGDVLASVSLSRTTGTATYSVGRCATPTCGGALDMIALGTFAGVTVGEERHTVRVSWDPVAERFTFRVDGQTVTVDPTTVLPPAGPPNAPLKRIFTYVGAPATAGSTTRAVATVNNVFVGP